MRHPPAPAVPAPPSPIPLWGTELSGSTVNRHASDRPTCELNPRYIFVLTSLFDWKNACASAKPPTNFPENNTVCHENLTSWSRCEFAPKIPPKMALPLSYLSVRPGATAIPRTNGESSCTPPRSIPSPLGLSSKVVTGLLDASMQVPWAPCTRPSTNARRVLEH